MRTAAILLLVSTCLRGSCVAVPSDKILARDLFGAVPVLRALDPDTIIGFAPFPGTQRVLSSRDLLLAARHFGVAFSSDEAAPSVCIERMVQALHLEQVRAALLLALNTSVNCPDVQLEVLEISSRLFPPGRLVFQTASLNKPPESNPQTPVIWQGQLVYDEHHSLSLWVKVRISVNREVFRAKESIPGGAVIRADQLIMEQIPQFPWPESPPLSMSRIVGKVARRLIPAGQKVGLEELEEAKEVMRGETVQVKVIDGAATITLDAVAESSGVKGESILVHNSAGGKSFRAVVENRDQVIVLLKPWSTL